MTPTTRPIDENGYTVVRKLSSVTDLTEWVDYIPVQEVTEVAAAANRYRDDGHIQCTTTVPE